MQTKIGGHLTTAGAIIALASGVLGTAACRSKARHDPAPAVSADEATPAVAGASTLADSEIAEAVRRELGRDPGIDAGKIDVAVKTGIAEITGKVSDLLSRERAAEIAALVKGVRSVSNRLVLEPVDRPDADIVRDVERALVLDPAADAYEVQVEAKDGVVRLRGKVQSWQEKALSERLAKGVHGVREVDNDLSLEYVRRRPDTEIAEDVRSRLRWDALVRSGLLRVNVKNGEVELRGVVGSAAEKRRAYVDALVSGAHQVDDSKVEVRWWMKSDDLRGPLMPRSPSEIERAIHTALTYDPRIAAADIRVFVLAGVVTLRGKVESLNQRMIAEATALNTVGVSGVDNEIVVVPVGPISDEQLERNIESALAFNPAVHGYQVKVEVRDGHVTLQGSVDDFFQKAQASSTAGGLSGVKSVVNDLAVRRPSKAYVFRHYLGPYTEPYVEGFKFVSPAATRSDADIEREIRDELDWSPFLDADEIRVVVEQGKATLTGEVETDLEREQATASAFEAGAAAVDNQIEVE